MPKSIAPVKEISALGRAASEKELNQLVVMNLALYVNNGQGKWIWTASICIDDQNAALSILERLGEKYDQEWQIIDHCQKIVSHHSKSISKLTVSNGFKDLKGNHRWGFS